MLLPLALLMPLALASAPRGGAEAPEPLSLAEAVARAEAADERFRLTELAETSAYYRANEILGRALPTLSAGVTVTRNAKEVEVGEGASARVISPLVQPQGTVVGRVKLFRGSEIPDAIAGYVSASAEEAAQAEARDALRGDIGALYLDLAEAQAVVTVLVRAKETNEELLRIARARVDHDAAIALDVDQARAEVLRTEADLERVRGLADEVAALLALRIDAPVGTAFVASCEGCVTVPGVYGGEGLAERSDLVALERRATAAGITAVGRWLRFLPSLEVVGNVRLAEPTLFNPDPLWWNAQLLLTWDLFSGTSDVWSALGQGVESERADLGAAIATEEAKVAVRQAERALAAARAELVASEARVEAATRALDVAEVRFREGLSSSVEVTEVARRRAEADAALVRSRYAVYRAALRLRRALGLGPVEEA